MIKNTIQQLRFVTKKPAIISRIIKNLFVVRVLKQNRLRTVDFAMTYKCNGCCPMCSARDLMRQSKDKQELSVEEIIDTMRQAARLGAIHMNLTGGEPTMRDFADLTQIIEGVNKLRCLISMVTNSINMTFEDLNWYKWHGLDTIQLSLESMYSDKHDKARGTPRNWDKLMQILQWALKLKLNVCLSCVVANDNFQDVRDIIAFGKMMGVFVLLNPISHNESRSIKNMKKKYYELFRDSHVRADTVMNWRGGSGCPGGIERIYITPFGDIMQCPHVAISYGNIRQEPLAKIYDRICQQPQLKTFEKDCRWLWNDEYRVWMKEHETIT